MTPQAYATRILETFQRVCDVRLSHTERHTLHALIAGACHDAAWQAQHLGAPRVSRPLLPRTHWERPREEGGGW